MMFQGRSGFVRTTLAYVTDASKPGLLSSPPKGSTGGTGMATVTLKAPATLTAPPASQVIDGSKLGL